MVISHLSQLNGALLKIALPLLLGTVWLSQQPEVPSVWWALLLPPLALLGRIAPASSPLFWLLLGVIWASIHAELRLSQYLPEKAEARDLLVVGEVVSLPEQRSSGAVRFRFRVDQALLDDRPIPFTAPVQLNWYRPSHRFAVDQHWRLLVRLKQPHGFANPGGFDWEGWLFQQGVRATGYVRQSDQNRLIQDGEWSVNTLRADIGQWIEQSTVGSPTSRSILKALSIGKRDTIDPADWELLRNSGTNHLIAISGLHIGLIATVSWLLFRWLGALSTRLLLWIPAQQIGAVGAIIGATAYALLAGFTIPTQRALVMVVVIMGVVLLRRASGRWSGYSLALVLVLLIDPFSVLSAGFWLSFTAVGWILYVLPNHHSQPKWINLLYLQLVLLIGLAPLLLYQFQQVSLVSPLANLIAVPWIGLLVVPLVLLSILLHLLYLPGAEWLLGMAALLLDGLIPLLKMVSQLSFSQFYLHRPGLLTVLTAMAGVALLLRNGLGWHRLWGLLAMLPLLLLPPSRPEPGQAWVTVLDVGQGLSVVVETPKQVMVYDTGDRFSSTFDAGSAVVVPFLRSRGWQAVDLLVIGHGDRDHIGGFQALSRQFPIHQTVSSVPEQVNGADHCHSGMEWQWDSVHIEMLHPPTPNTFHGNDGSCVVRIEANGERLLLTGDIEKRAEQWMVEHIPEKLKATLLVVPHHGSDSSSTEAFIEAVSPHWAVIPVGYYNRYRLPREAVIQRYRERGVQLWNSADDGAVSMVLDGENRVPQSWRQENRRIWHDLP